MHVKKMLAPAVIAVVLAASAHAGRIKPTPGPAPDCLRYEYAYALSSDGQTLHVDATVRNDCFPAVDMEGTVLLSVAGQVIGQAPLGALDTATISADVPLDAVRGQQLCLEFKGTRAELIRRKLQVSAIESQDCRIANF